MGLTAQLGTRAFRSRPHRKKWHFARELREIPSWMEPETRTYRDYLADFRAEFHDLRRDRKHASALDPDNYDDSQHLARTLLNGGSAGIIYPSVRHRGGTCIACFRPALVTNVREGVLVSIAIADSSTAPIIRVESN